jgi:hypothetical protein
MKHNQAPPCRHHRRTRGTDRGPATQARRAFLRRCDGREDRSSKAIRPNADKPVTAAPEPRIASGEIATSQGSPVLVWTGVAA